MSMISLTKIQNVLPEFIDTRLMPTAPDWIKFLLGASKPFALRRADELITQNLQMLKASGMVNEQNQLDIEKFKVFLDGGFNSSPKVTLFGFNFDKQDGDALMGIIDKYKDS